ncbi:MAG: Cache 3/Cache 2 fusion domain-containing protein [Leptospiraceae bacterium]|nr:Cache 3/Cache 2 fusion domain-containing protein [Leptospiraceae bacterium]
MTLWEKGFYVGARFIGIDITKDLEDLKSKIRKIKIGETGYSYVMSDNETNKAERSLLHKNKK